MCKQEGLVAAAMPSVFWNLFYPYTKELLRFVIAGKQLLFHIVKNSPDIDNGEQAAFLATRFLTTRDERASEEQFERTAGAGLEQNDLPTQSLMRHLGDWMARPIGSVRHWEAGPNEAAATNMSRHSLGTSSNRYVADTNRHLERMRNVSQRYFGWLLEEEDLSQVPTQGIKRERSMEPSSPPTDAQQQSEKSQHYVPRTSVRRAAR